MNGWYIWLRSIKFFLNYINFLLNATLLRPGTSNSKVGMNNKLILFSALYTLSYTF